MYKNQVKAVHKALLGEGAQGCFHFQGTAHPVLLPQAGFRYCLKRKFRPTGVPCCRLVLYQQALRDARSFCCFWTSEKLRCLPPPRGPWRETLAGRQSVLLSAEPMQLNANGTDRDSTKLGEWETSRIIFYQETALLKAQLESEQSRSTSCC